MSLTTATIRRPVFTTVLALIIVLFGGIGFFQLGIREYPAIDPPIITLVTVYPGASASVVESQITEPLEEAVSAVGGVDVVTSTSREGSSQIRIQFTLNTDLEVAANDVRDQLGRAVRTLPPDANPPIVFKSDADSTPVIGLVVKSGQRDLMELTAIAEEVKNQLQTVEGVGLISLVGEKRYSMRLSLNPRLLAAYNLTVLDVRDAVRRQNVELPSGRVEGNQVELTVSAQGRLATPQEFENVILKRSGDQVVRLGDVGRAQLAPLNDRSLLRVGDETMIGVYLRAQPGANQVLISESVRERMRDIQRFLPEDVSLILGYDNTEYVNASISEIKETLLIAVCLVIIVIFAFLRDWRSTLIPAIVIPIALIGTFFVMYVVGFSINTMTLLGLVLAVGLVVDDAIVVLENIFRRLEKGQSPFSAGEEGTKEIFFAVISTTLALAAVFLPVIFLPGMTGSLFREFGVVIACAVLFSSFLALTLTPMMTVRLLKPKAGGPKHGLLYRFFERGFKGLNDAYSYSLNFFLKVRYLAWAILLLVGLGTVYFYTSLPKELTPLEDRGRIWVRVTGPEGASFEYMEEVMTRLTNAVEAQVPEARIMMTQVPSGGIGGTGAVNNGFVRIFLAPRDERDRSQQEIAADLQRVVRQIPGARAGVVQEPSVGVNRGTGLNAQIVVRAATLERLEAIVPSMLDRMNAEDAFSFVDVDLKFSKPELAVLFDRERIENLGISVAAVAETIQTALSGQRFGFFLLEGKQYEVIGELKRENRNSSAELGAIGVRTATGVTVPLDSLARFEERVTPPQRFRFNRQASATFSANMVRGRTLGEGTAILESIASELIDERYSLDFAGASREYREAASSMNFIFILSLVLVYFVLAAQFESFRGPFIIILTVPLAVSGALLALKLTGETINLFSQIGIVMLVGLITKNGILIVEFANQKQKEGLSRLDAARIAAGIRFRPVLMTSLSTILGALPIALAVGAGAESRTSLGLTVIGGLLIGSVLTLYILPAVYSFIAKDLNKKTGTPITEPKPAESVEV